MASVISKKVNGGTYYYLREMGRVNGKPKMISERYLGKAEDIAAALDGASSKPERTRHLGFGDLAAVWLMLTRLDVAGIVDDVVGTRREDAGATIGTYLSLIIANRIVAPCSKLAFADWWTQTAGDRFVKIPQSGLDHRRFWDAMDCVNPDDVVEIERRVVASMISIFDLDVSALALDMTNFATFIDSGNERNTIAQRGKAKQKRNDLRIVGLGLVVTRDDEIPVVSHAYAGNRHDSTQFPLLIKEMGKQLWITCRQQR
jgi:transposase